MSTIIETINKYVTLSPEATKDILSVIEQINAPKGTVLHKHGQVMNYMFYIQSGMIRNFYFREGKEVTSDIVLEGSFATMLYSYVKRKPSFGGMETLENSVLHRVHYDDMQRLMDKHHDVERMVRILMELHYAKAEEEMVINRFLSAYERYEKLMHENPAILQRTPLKHVASLLGMSQETLSRIRASASSGGKSI